MEGQTDVDRLRARVEQETQLRQIRAAVADMQGQLKERSRLCRDRCAKLTKVHQRIEESIISGQSELFDAGMMLSPEMRELMASPSIE